MPTRARSTARGEDQEIDRGIFQKVDAIGEQGNRTDYKGNGELNPEIGQVEKRYKADGAAQSVIGRQPIHTRPVRASGTAATVDCAGGRASPYSQ
jgi:hypothetical protein